MEIVEKVVVPELTKRQIAIWAVIGIVILLIGANYLRSHKGSAEPAGDGLPVASVAREEPVPATIKVHVVGAVAQPGLYDIEAGSRVADAIGRAGGPSPTADLSRVNLAAKVADGQQLVIPAAGEPLTGGTVSGGGGPAAVADQPVNLNSANIDQLTGLDGIGPKTAQKIIDYRESHGGFNHIEELMEVPGIGPAKFDQIKDRVVV